MKETPKVYYADGRPLNHSVEVTRQLWPVLQDVKKLEAELLDHERKYLNELARQITERGYIESANAGRWAENTLQAVEQRRLKAAKIATQKKALPNA